MLLYVFHGCVTFDPINDKIAKEVLSYNKTIPHVTEYNTLIFLATADTRLCVSSCACMRVRILYVDQIKFMRGVFRQYLRLLKT